MKQEDQELLYQAAYEAYTLGNYEEARGIFEGLVMASSLEPRFWFGLASSYQMERKFEKALKVWAAAALVDPTSPYPHLHAAECFIHSDNPQEAKKALEAASKHACGECLNKVERLYAYCR